MVLVTDGNGCHHVVSATRYHYADWDLAIVRRIRGIQATTASVKAYLAGNMPTQISLYSVNVYLRDLTWCGVRCCGVKHWYVYHNFTLTFVREACRPSTARQLCLRDFRLTVMETIL